MPASDLGRHAADDIVLATDVGNSKTDLVLVRADGMLLAAVRGPTASHQAAGMSAGMDMLERLASEAARRAGLDPSIRPIARVAVHCMAGADLAEDVRALERELAARRLAAESFVLNDTAAVLRAGTARTWGVAVICGSGINCLGLAPDGRTYRLPALGQISGDWGGGQALGQAALEAAVRARDGRGPRTALEHVVPERFGFRRPIDVTRALYAGRLPERRLDDLAPAVFETAMVGDVVARSIVDRLADEIVTMAAAAIRRLGLVRSDPDVVLGGGVFRTTDAAFYERIDAGLGAVAPRACAVRLTAAPVLGSALLALDRVHRSTRGARAGDGLPAAIEANLRAHLHEDRIERVDSPDHRPEGRTPPGEPS